MEQGFITLEAISAELETFIDNEKIKKEIEKNILINPTQVQAVYDWN